jgi:hypothetical protein
LKGSLSVEDLNSSIAARGGDSSLLPWGGINLQNSFPSELQRLARLATGCPTLTSHEGSAHLHVLKPQQLHTMLASLPSCSVHRVKSFHRAKSCHRVKPFYRVKFFPQPLLPLQTLPNRCPYLKLLPQSFLLSRRSRLHLKLHLRLFPLRCILTLCRARLNLAQPKSPICRLP